MGISNSSKPFLSFKYKVTDKVSIPCIFNQNVIYGKNENLCINSNFSFNNSLSSDKALTFNSKLYSLGFGLEQSKVFWERKSFLSAGIESQYTKQFYSLDDYLRNDTYIMNTYHNGSNFIKNTFYISYINSFRLSKNYGIGIGVSGQYNSFSKTKKNQYKPRSNLSLDLSLSKKISNSYYVSFNMETSTNIFAKYNTILTDTNTSFFKKGQFSGISLNLLFIPKHSINYENVSNELTKIAKIKEIDEYIDPLKIKYSINKRSKNIQNKDTLKENDKIISPNNSDNKNKKEISLYEYALNFAKRHDL